MFRNKFVIAFFLVIFFCLALLGRINPVLAKQKLTVFLLPHQDDEMFLLGAIRRAINKKNSVYVIMVTDGGKSNVLKQLNGEDDQHRPVLSIYDHKYLSPSAEGYVPLNRRTFAAARNREFYATMMATGLTKSHIIFANKGGLEGSDSPHYRDGELTKEQATAVIKKYRQLLGDGSYVTLEANGRHVHHPDHVALHEALSDAPGIKEKHYYSEKILVGTPILLSKDERLTKTKALNNYFIWKPAEGRFAVGVHSVEWLFNYWKDNPIEYAVKK